MLKAMGYGESNSIVGRPFTLALIEHKLTLHQIEFVYGGTLQIQRDVFSQLNADEKKAIKKRVRMLAKWGIPEVPGLDESNRARLEKLELILRDMVHRGKLKYHPPDAYAVV